MRVLVSGGGTGGHINPALSIADKIKECYPDAVVEYVGTEKGMENILVSNAGYKIHHIKVKGFKRKLTIENFDAALKAVTSVMEANKLIKKFKPDIVIGTGGYVSWPVLKAASKNKIKTCIHEQNAVPGITTKMLSKYVDKVMISFEQSREYFDCEQEKIQLVGNPVSGKMLLYSKAKAREELSIPLDAKVILSCGGSLGARPLNENVYRVIENFSLVEDVYHFHATGKAGWETQKELYKQLGFKQIDDETLKYKNVTVTKYIYNMHQLLPACDIQICRAGAITLAELALLGKAAIIIPSPYVTNNHQYKNAKVLEDMQAVFLIEEKSLSETTLTESVRQLIYDNEKRAIMEQNVKKFAVTDTLERIMCIIEDLVKS